MFVPGRSGYSHEMHTMMCSEWSCQVDSYILTKVRCDEQEGEVLDLSCVPKRKRKLPS
jgi:hypothetical protein